MPDTKAPKETQYFNFGQDLKISIFEEALQRYAQLIYNDKLKELSGTAETNTPNQYKSKFFFKPYSNAGELALEKNYFPVIINYIKKFQYPDNTNKQSRTKCIENNIFLAPNRLIFQLLVSLNGIDHRFAFLTEDEVYHFVYLRALKKDMSSPDIELITEEILDGRKKQVNYNGKAEIVLYWNQPTRQYPESVVAILAYTGLIYTNSENTIFLSKHLTRKQKAYLFEIVTYKKFIKQIVTDEDYADYMDISDEEMQIIKEDDPMPETKPFENFKYKVFDTNDEKRYNRIIFGAPGTGKSHQIDIDKDNLKDLDVFERVTFHPNYTYSQFVGTYKPVTEGKDIAYKYVEGPFMRLLTAALENAKDKNQGSRKRYLLIIEEINRANVAAVFGDMFQLLDRKDGVSEYEIQTSEDVRKYLAAKLGGDGSEDKYKTLQLPNNFYIWATMNSADQGVFPMDTAFKRRWEFEYIDINKNTDKLVYEDGKDIFIPIPIENNVDSKEKKNLKYNLYKWNDVRKKINEKLSAISSVNEDKLLGPFFFSLDKLRSAKDEPQKFIELFKSKVLMYLFEDVVKISPTKLFVNCGDHPRYSTICSKFDEIGCGIFDIKLQDNKSNESENDQEGIGE